MANRKKMAALVNSLSKFHLTKGEREVTPWRGQQSSTGLTLRQTCMDAPTHNSLVSLVSLTCTAVDRTKEGKNS